MIGATYFGDLERGAAVVEPLRRFGRPVMEQIAPAPYLTIQTQMDGMFRPGVRSYVKSGMVREFTQDLIDDIVNSYEPDRMVAIGSHAADGAVSRVDETATAWPHRNALTMLAAFTVWTDPADDERMIEANRAQWAAIEPHTGGYYENIQAESSGVSQNFGPVYDRLVRVKTEHDPMNLFRLNSNIKPSA
jgi:hypothetical protein